MQSLAGRGALPCASDSKIPSWSVRQTCEAEMLENVDDLRAMAADGLAGARGGKWPRSRRPMGPPVGSHHPWASRPP
jgi:hypothetical protein